MVYKRIPNLSNLSINQKLLGLNIFSCSLALLLAGGAFVLHDVVTFRSSLLQGLSTQAAIIGFNTASALRLHDTEDAAQTLSALHATPNLIRVAIYTKEGNLFTVWHRDPTDTTKPPSFPSRSDNHLRFRNKSVEMFQPITINGDQIGTVYIQSTLKDLQERQVRYAFITVVVLSFSFFIIILVSTRFGNMISQPILNLTKLAKTISNGKDYSVRALATSHDEVGLLVDTFNEMLGRIQANEEALRKSHEELERRVKDRTAQLEAANKELEAFSYSVSHDLRAPLRSVNGFAIALAEDNAAQLDPEGKDYLNRIRAASQKMGQLIDDMLNLSRITVSPMEKETVDLSSLAAAVIEDLRKGQPDRCVVVDIEGGMTASGDSRFLKIALENLLGNAWKYTGQREEAKIEFRMTDKEGKRVYFIRDNGAGFDMAYAQKLFGAFQRFHSEEEFSGTGIGLATVKRILARHEGKIWAESEVNKGATFYFTL